MLRLEGSLDYPYSIVSNNMILIIDKCASAISKTNMCTLNIG